MAEQAHKNAASGGGHPPARGVLLGVVVSVLIVSTFVFTVGHVRGGAIGTKDDTNVANVLVYSPTCPHCHALIKYLQEKGLIEKWHLEKTTNPASISEVLKKLGLSFEGYPTLVIYAPDANLPPFIKTAPYIVLVGFPAGPNDVNGYYMGEKTDLSLCKGMHGTPVYERGKYLFCVRKDGVILGNEHAIDWISQKIGSAQ